MARTFALLNTAIEKGFNAKTDFESDAGLTSLRQDARWKEILIKLK